MQDKYILAGIGCICVITGTIAGLVMGHDGTLIATGLSAVTAICAGTIGFAIGKKE